MGRGHRTQLRSATVAGNRRASERGPAANPIWRRHNTGSDPARFVAATLPPVGDQPEVQRIEAIEKGDLRGAVWASIQPDQAAFDMSEAKSAVRSALSDEIATTLKSVAVGVPSASSASPRTVCGPAVSVQDAVWRSPL
jgi:hypothetical protein